MAYLQFNKLHEAICKTFSCVWLFCTSFRQAIKGYEKYMSVVVDSIIQVDPNSMFVFEHVWWLKSNWTADMASKTFYAQQINVLNVHHFYFRLIFVLKFAWLAAGLCHQNVGTWECGNMDGVTLQNCPCKASTMLKGKGHLLMRDHTWLQTLLHLGQRHSTAIFNRGRGC